MNYKYFPHTDTELKEMLEVCGKRSLDELFDMEMKAITKADEAKIITDKISDDMNGYLK